MYQWCGRQTQYLLFVYMKPTHCDEFYSLPYRSKENDGFGRVLDQSTNSTNTGEGRETETKRGKFILGGL